MVRRAILVLCVLVASACHSAPAAAPSSDADGIRSVRYVGRFDWNDPAGPRYAWSGATMRARFRGSSIAFRVRAAPVPSLTKGEPARERATPYTAIIDGVKKTIPVGDASERYELARGLDPDRVHEASLTREAEAMAGVHQFLGFEVEGKILPPPPPRRYAIEIVGDSITCGYGILGADKSCSFSYETERASTAFGVLAGEMVDADVRLVCWSGFGVIRNYDRTSTPTMPELFERALPESSSAPWFGTREPGPDPTARRTPDVVVVALGTNDFQESSKTALDLQAFRTRFESFLARVRAVYGSAWILVTESPLLGPDPTPSGPGTVREVAHRALANIVLARRSAGDTRVELLELPWAGDRLGCDWHPNAEMHRILAAELARALRTKLGVSR